MATASRDPYIRKRGPLAGREVWRGYATDPVTGKPVTRGKFVREVDALVWAQRHEEDLAKAATAPAEPTPIPDVASWWETVQERGLWPVSEGNRANRDRDLRLYVLHRWGGTPLDELQPSDVTDWLMRLTTQPLPEDRLAGEYRARKPPPPKAPPKLRLDGQPKGHRAAAPPPPPPVRPLTPVSVATAARAYAALRRLVQIAVERGVVVYNPVSAAHLPRREGGSDPKYATTQQVRAAARLLPPRLQAPAVLAALTGLRLGELRALDEESWQPGQDFLVVDRVIIETPTGFAWRPVTKGLRHREVPLVVAARAILERHADWWPPAPVPLPVAQDDGRHRTRTRVEPRLWLTDDDGLPLGRTRVITAWDRAQEEAGAGRITWHGLRHTYASMLITAGEPIGSIASLLGHSTTRTTEIYARVIGREYATARAHLTAAASTLAWVAGAEDPDEPFDADVWLEGMAFEEEMSGRERDRETAALSVEGAPVDDPFS